MVRVSCLFRTILCGFFILCLSVAASAQFKAGIQGTVTDTGGGLVPEAKITLTNNETGKTQETTASAEGFYRLSGLAPGKYKMAVEKAGYKQKVFDNVVVNAEAVQGVDVALEAGDISATVTVTQDTVPILDTENANIDKAITTQEVRTLPQFGRDPYNFRTSPARAGQTDPSSRPRTRFRLRLTANGLLLITFRSMARALTV